MTDDSLTSALEAAARRVLEHLATELADLGLRQAEINVLAALRPGVARPVGELVAATGQRPSTLTGVLDRMERKRLARRRVNVADRRSFTIALTPTGEAAAARVRDAFAALDRRVRDDVSPDAIRGFHHVLDALERHAKGRT